MRILALLAVVIAAVFAAAGIAVTLNNVAYPRCADVLAGIARLPADGKCYAGSAFQQYGTLVSVFLGAAAVAVAMALSLVLLVKGTRGRLFVAALGCGVALMLIGALITHASTSHLPGG